MRTGLIVRHVPYEGIAGFRAPIEAAGYVLDRLDVGTADLRDVDLCAPDLLILMGGPMGVYETDAHPWLGDEIGKVAARLAADRPTLGICLGAQIVAAALGAAVYPAGVKEVGFEALTLTAAGAASPLRHLDGQPILHWHGDTFDLPAGAELLASTPRCRHQVFRRGARLLALQCHAEMGEDPRFDAWLEGADDYVAEAGTSAAALRQQQARYGADAVRAGRAMITEWLARLGD